MKYPFNVILVSQNALSPRDYKRFGAEFAHANGCPLTFVDVSPIVIPHIEQDRSRYADFAGIDIVSCTAAKQLELAIAAVPDPKLVILNVGSGVLTPSNIAVYRAISNTSAPYLLESTNAFPGWASSGAAETGAFSKVWRIVERARKMDLPKSLAARVPPACFGIRPASFIVYAGLESQRPNRFVGSQTETILAHSMDYEHFREFRAAASAKTDTAVFIDEYRPYHRDLKEMGMAGSIDADRYFAAMRGIFTRIEAETGLEVIIAVSPRADYSDKPGVYGARRMVPAATPRLIAESRLVLAHRSTAIGFGVMFDVPIMLIATREIYDHPSQKQYFDAFAEVLGKPLQFVENAADVVLDGVFEIDRDAYARYMTNYVKAPGSPDLPFWEIVFDRVAESLTRGQRAAVV